MNKSSLEISAADVGVWLSSEHVVALDERGSYGLRGSRCKECAQVVFPSSEICPFCLAEGCANLPLHGDATLYSFTCLQTGPKRWTVPYAIGYADFANGIRLFAKLSGPQSARGPWQIDQTVRLAIEHEAASGDSPERFRYYFEEAGT